MILRFLASNIIVVFWKSTLFSRRWDVTANPIFSCLFFFLSLFFFGWGWGRVVVVKLFSEVLFIADTCSTPLFKAIPIKDPHVLSKIHQTYRVGYLKVCFLNAEVWDDSVCCLTNGFLHSSSLLGCCFG